jgi:beta-galactosidase
MKIKNSFNILFIILCCSVWICYAGQSLLKETPFIHTTAETITTEFTINNSSKDDFVCRYSQHLTDADGESVYKIGPVSVSVAAGREEKILFSENPSSLNLWSPEDPYLYRVVTVIESGRHEARVFENNIGFRTFEIRGSHFYLNGRPYFLRALSRIPPGRVHDAECNIRPEIWRDEHFVRDFFEKLKDANVNTIRVCGPVDNDMIWFDYADKMGIMMVNGSYRGEGVEGESVIEHNRSIFVPVIKNVRNYTSPVIYTLSNELQWDKNDAFLPGARKNYEIAKGIDPTRLIIGNAGFGRGMAGDIEDVHDYLGWYYGAMSSYSRYMTGSSKVDYRDGKGNDKPVTFTEMIGTYTNNRDGSFYMAYNKHHANALRLVGTSASFAEDSMWYQALITKEMVEAMRRARGMQNRICGTFPFSTYWFWDIESKTARAKPAIEALKMSYSPVLLSMHTWKRNLYQKDQFSCMLHVVNDDYSLGSLTGAKARLSLVQDGAVRSTVLVDLPRVDYYDTFKSAVNLDIPDGIAEGTSDIKAELIHPKADCSGNTLEIYVAGRDFADTDIKEKVFVFDNTGETLNALVENGFNAVNADSIRSLSPENKLVIAAGVIDTQESFPSEAFWEFIKAGGHALVLEQEYSANREILPEGFTIIQADELFVNIDRDLKHPLLGGLRHRDMFAFNNISPDSVDSYTVRKAFHLTPESLDSAEVAANCDSHLAKAAVVEYFAGKGSVIFSQIECMKRAGIDPVADRVRTNLVSMLIKSDHLFGEQSGWEIKFADFDSERGLFASPLKQGFIINSHNYGRVNYGDVAGTGWGAGRPDGRRVTGELKITRSLGYLGHVDEESSHADGFFWVRPPKDADSANIVVANPTDKPLKFAVKASGSEIQTYTASPGERKPFGPLSFKRLDNGAVKFTIRTSVDKEGQGKEKKLVEELVFDSLVFLK